MRIATRASLCAVLLLVLAACGGPPNPAPRGMEVGGPTPAGAVERFMGLVAESEIQTMGWVFGTRDGPLAQSADPERLRRRMAGIAAALRHDGYSLTGVQPVAGRPEAREILVDLRRGRQTARIALTVVQGPRERWFVERVPLESARNQ